MEKEIEIEDVLELFALKEGFMPYEVKNWFDKNYVQKVEIVENKIILKEDGPPKIYKEVEKNVKSEIVKTMEDMEITKTCDELEKGRYGVCRHCKGYNEARRELKEKIK